LIGKTQTVRFASLNQDHSVSLERCVQQRRSVRSFRDQAVTKEELGQLLWAARVVTGPDNERAVPSTGALYPLELYVAIGSVTSLTAGVYQYVAGCHELVPVASGDQREKLVDAALGQDWIAAAPACICIAAVFERATVKYGNRGRGYVYMEAGHAAERLMPQAVALGLATKMVGVFSDDEVSRLLRLGADETPLCLIPVGRL
jgi:SagB-type dehydrogenase family enzyme